MDVYNPGADVTHIAVWVAAVIAFLILLRIANIFRYISNNQVGIVEKLWSPKGSVTSGFIALSGESVLESDAVLMWKEANPSESGAFRDSTALGRFGDIIKDAGGLATFLASSQSDYITGMTFMLDGGCFMYP